VSNYFNVRVEKIVQEMEEKHLEMESLKKSLGPLTRYLTSLSEVKKGGIHNCVVKILSVSRKLIVKDDRAFTIITVLIADQYSIGKMLLFDNKELNKTNLRENALVRLHEVYYEKKDEYDSVIKLKRGGNIFSVPFGIPGMDYMRRPEVLEVDELGEYVSDPKHVPYIQEIGIIHVIGVLLKDEKKDVYMLYGGQFNIVVWMKDDLKEFINQHCLNRKVELTYVKIKYGRDSLELIVTEFSKVLIKNYEQLMIVPKNYYRYEYPAQVMSLKEMLDTGLVAISSVAITYVEDRETDEGKEYSIVYLYDSTALIRLFLFEKEVIEVFKGIPYFTRFRMVSGIYKKSMKVDPKYAETLPVVNVRVKDEIVEVSEDFFEPTITLLKNIIDFSQPVVTEGVLKEKEEAKVFHYKDGGIGYKVTFTIQQQGERYKITTFNKRHVQFIENVDVENEIRVWWVEYRKNRYIIESYGKIQLR
jgi:hypothetical protein